MKTPPRTRYLTKIVGLLCMTAICLIPVSAAVSTSTNFQLRSFYGSGGISDTNLTQQGVNASFGFTQYIIGNNTATNSEALFGLYYIATVGKVSAITPAAVIFLFNFFIMERGMEFIKINWTRQ